MQGEQEDIDRAVGAAREAFKSWSKLPGHVRARYLYSIARHVQKHARLVAVLESMDNGKPIRETRDADVQIVARHLYHHAGWAQLMDTEMRGKQVMTSVESFLSFFQLVNLHVAKKSLSSVRSMSHQKHIYNVLLVTLISHEGDGYRYTYI